MTTADARRSPRVTVAWKAKVLVEHAEPIWLRVVDVSEGGIGVLGSDPFRKGQVLPINLMLPLYDNRAAVQSVYFGAVVTYQVLSSGQYRHGLQFGQLDLKTRAWIRQWVDHAPRAPGTDPT